MRGLNYTEAFDNIHKERFFFIEIKRKSQIIMVGSIVTFLAVLLFLLFNISLNAVNLSIYGLILLLIFIGLGFDMEDVPAWKFLSYACLKTASVRIAGETIFIEKSHKLKIYQKRGRSKKSDRFNREV
ncbi:MAG: hypothetical protein ACRC6X_06590 [Culicoidibacterales bacterium]